MWKKLNGSNCFERNWTAQSVDVKETERLNLLMLKKVNGSICLKETERLSLFERNLTAQSVDAKEIGRLKL